MTDLIGSDEAARILGWSRSKVKREAKPDGSLAELVAMKMPGDTGAYLFHRAKVEQLAAKVSAA